MLTVSYICLACFEGEFFISFFLVWWCCSVECAGMCMCREVVAMLEFGLVFMVLVLVFLLAGACEHTLHFTTLPRVFHLACPIVPSPSLLYFLYFDPGTEQDCKQCK